MGGVLPRLVLSGNAGADQRMGGFRGGHGYMLPVRHPHGDRGMNDQAVEALRDAMEPPTWWTNRARLSPREILDRLEEHGYTVAPVNQIADASSQTSSAVNEEPVSGTLWPEMAARAEQLAAWEARSDERLEAVAVAVDSAPPTPEPAAVPELREVPAPEPPAVPELREIPAPEDQDVLPAESAEAVTAESAPPGSPAESAPAESHRPGGLAGLMADLESKVAAVRHVRSEESTPADEDQQRSA